MYGWTENYCAATLSLCRRRSFGCKNEYSQLYASGEDVELFIFWMASTFRLVLPVEQTVKWLWLRSPLNAEAFNGSVYTVHAETFRAFFCSHVVWKILCAKLSTEVNAFQCWIHQYTLHTRVDFDTFSFRFTFDFCLFSTLTCYLPKHFILDKWKLASFKWFHSINIPNFREYFR